MSSFNIRNNKVAEAANDAGQSICNKKIENINGVADSVDNGGEKSDLIDSAYFPGKSRYGRTIKPKSPRDDISESSKNYKMSKTRKSQNSSENSNENVDESNIVNDGDEASDSFSSTNSMEEILSPKFDNTPAQSTWNLGQLAWARVGNFPFWPCVVTLDPTTLIFYKYKATGRSQLLMIHVQYFGDKGRHSWVSSHYMIPFTNLDDFLKLSESLPAEMKRKDTKYAAGFIIKAGLKSKWDTAVEEATDVKSMSDQERADIFKPVVKRQRTQKTPDFCEKDKSGKRKLTSDLSGPDAKRSKQENIDVSDKLQYKLQSPKLRYLRHNENGKANVRLNLESPSRMSTKSNESNDSSATQKSDFKSDERPEGVFEVYYERNRDMLEDEHPDLSEEEIRKYLRKTWNDMNSSFRRKYRLYVKSEGNQSKDDAPEESEEDTSTDAESVVTKDTKKVKSKIEKEDAVETKKPRPYNLFKGMKAEKVCQICEKTGKLTRCRGPCYSYFHLSCVKPGESSPEHSIDESTYSDKLFEDLREIKRSNTDDEENSDKAEEQEDESFKCIDCLSGVAPACFVCNEREGDRIRCSVLACGKHYHTSCLRSWPQSRWQGGRLNCPYHICHTCSSDNPQDSHSRAPNEKIAKCVRCPSSYHASISCLPAGSVILTGSQIVCPKHYKAPHPPLNAAWCFLCTRGGSLICCDTCPTSFHLECLGINAPDGAFICEDCETGRLPLYGEVVWVKLGNYRWWPSRICYPHEIPENVGSIPHSPGKFCVMFLGSNNYYWVHRGRAFLYQEGDATIKPSVGKKTMRNNTYRKALEEASEIHKRLKIERAAAKDIEAKGLKPPPYVKLKVNKPVGNVKPVEVESIVACDCDPELDDPCAPGTYCLNRILLIECSPGVCPAGTKCNNQDFARRQYPAMEPFHTVGRGWGLRSLEAIKFGQFVIEYVGEIIDEAEYRQRLTRKKELKNENFYFLTIDNNRMIDAEPKGNLSRFMNHSCSPNCETQKWTVNGDTRIGLFALQDIAPGEELTFNYNLACDGETRKACLCGAPNCSGFIGLKVQKPQITSVAVQPKKPEKVEKVKKRRLRKRFCWHCGQEITPDSEIIICDHKTCNKKYHSTCINIFNTESKFSCPWHHCLICNRRTSAHCSFCSAAFCQVHLDENLFEYGEKGGFVCTLHENMEVQRSSAEDEKDSSDNEAEIDKEYLSRSSSPIEMETKLQREPSPRVSIVEVHLNSEESEESQREEDEELLENTIALCTYNFSKTVKKKMLNQSSNIFDEGQAEKLNNLTSSQLEAIIGGSLFE
ncbi:PREDICTED: histone-lysine N-methyltransferase NSD2 isoform X1 [Polistes dominula]|uniref:Histone-lysine N-methyltransferase NSD2 isoform X1 n=1 Tax=Polistes dominula TaxID=743375 RepID=A0ABM1IUG0_POLDO|nr:PREDICTED: histone-lysine N-methyltransferase NSD2 isoform X1 [Polistes dominula]XP_015183847.1 PREDICTED: histone-lysine N-methyltransferase NSD2 isoform X1 [Polistes dominula]